MERRSSLEQADIDKMIKRNQGPISLRIDPNLNPTTSQPKIRTERSQELPGKHAQ